MGHSFVKIQVFVQKFSTLHRVEMVHVQKLVLSRLRKERQRESLKTLKLMSMRKSLKTGRGSTDKLERLQNKIRDLMEGLNRSMGMAFTLMGKEDQSDHFVGESARSVLKQFDF